MEGVLAAFAQFDNDCRSDRTRAGMKAALELGRWVFLAPLGYPMASQLASAALLFTLYVPAFVCLTQAFRYRSLAPAGQSSKGAARPKPLKG
jgi:hypothetical protein